MADATDLRLRELHRQAADLHRQAQHKHEGLLGYSGCTPSTSATPPNERSRGEDDPGAATERHDK
jgi:hypothetical protein